MSRFTHGFMDIPAGRVRPHEPCQRDTEQARHVVIASASSSRTGIVQTMDEDSFGQSRTVEYVLTQYAGTNGIPLGGGSNYMTVCSNTVTYSTINSRQLPDPPSLLNSTSRRDHRQDGKVVRTERKLNARNGELFGGDCRMARGQLSAGGYL